MGEAVDPQRNNPAPTPSRGLPERILDSLLEGIQVISPEFRYCYVNDAVVRQGRTTKQSLIGRTMMECYPGIEDTEMFETLRRCMDDRLPASIENEFTFPDGSTAWFELRFEPAPEGVIILSIEVTERKRAETELHRTMRALTTRSRFNETLVRASDETRFKRDVCSLVVESGGYRAAVIHTLARAGAKQSEVTSAGDLGDETGGGEGTRSLSLGIRAGETSIGTLTIVASEPDAFRDEEVPLLEAIACDVGYGIETLRRRVAHARTEEQLIAAQRLEAVARLAGGVAHDFNNLLSVILTYSGLAASELREMDPLHKDIEQVRLAAERAAKLTQQLLAFSRKQIIAPQVTSLNQVIGGIESMLRRLLGEDIEIEVHLAGDLGNVIADAGQLEQVIMNLAVNARDAMARGGRLTIETKNVELDQAYAEGHLSVKPGRYVQLSMADTGTGMTSETRKQLFEPFFTTKDKGKGTGLGLSTAYGIVKQSGGDIWVYSEPGGGATFKVYLPRVDAPVADARRSRPATVSSKNEWILLVEDDESVRKAAERILRSAGHKVVSAATGREALLLFEKYRGRIDLVLTDVIMPEMSGRSLADQLKDLAPELKVLFTSGYTDNAIVHHGVLEPGTWFISKPFSAVDLTHKVREVLDAE